MSTYNDLSREHEREHAILAWNAVHGSTPTDVEIDDLLEETSSRPGSGNFFSHLTQRNETRKSADQRENERVEKEKTEKDEREKGERSEREKIWKKEFEDRQKADAEAKQHAEDLKRDSENPSHDETPSPVNQQRVPSYENDRNDSPAQF